MRTWSLRGFGLTQGPHAGQGALALWLSCEPTGSIHIRGSGDPTLRGPCSLLWLPEGHLPQEGRDLLLANLRLSGGFVAQLVSVPCSSGTLVMCIPTFFVSCRAGGWVSLEPGS